MSFKYIQAVDITVENGLTDAHNHTNNHKNGMTAIFLRRG